MGGAPGESTGRIGGPPRMGTQFGGTPFAAKPVNFYQLNLSCSMNFYHVLCFLVAVLRSGCFESKGP